MMRNLNFQKIWFILCIGILFLCLPILGWSQSKLTKTLHRQIREEIKSKSMVSDHIHWKDIEKAYKALPFSGNPEEERKLLFAFYSQKLKEAGDDHSVFVAPDLAQSLQSNPQLLQYPEATVLEENIGYIRLPSCMRFDPNFDRQYTDTLYQQFKSLRSKSITRWIVDLRGNAGGNVYPMLQALLPIMPANIVFQSIEKDLVKPQTIGINAASKAIGLVPFEKIALLLDQHTASSGELTAIALLGFEQVKSFGAPSRGLTTLNTTLVLKDGSYLFLAKSYMADQHQKTYPKGLIPEVILEESDDYALIKRAMAWLNEKTQN
jgi:carboxyl-terminal processing protease